MGLTLPSAFELFKWLGVLELRNYDTVPHSFRASFFKLNPVPVGARSIDTVLFAAMRTALNPGDL